MERVLAHFRWGEDFRVDYRWSAEKYPENHLPGKTVERKGYFKFSLQRREECYFQFPKELVWQIYKTSIKFLSQPDRFRA